MKPRKRVEKMESADPDDWPVTKAERALLKARIAAMDDPTRYVIVSPFSKKFCLYYEPGDGHFVMNRITPECLFKNQSEAQAVAKQLERRRARKTRKSLQVLRVRKTKTGVRILDQISDPWTPSETWKPVLRKEGGRPPGSPPK